MASIQIIKIEFIQDAPYGGRVAGDVIDVYLDDQNLIIPAPFLGGYQGVTYNLNGVPGDLDFASSLITLSPDIVSVTNFNVSFCSGNYLITTKPSTLSPFGYYLTFADHYSCQINPPTCNLVVSGVPTVINCTDSLTNDGSIQITATSSNPIQYKIGTDFVYNDGTAQSSGLFSGLLPGNYVIFIRDSANCYTYTNVVVGIDNSYGTRFRLEYDDLKGWKTRVLITKRSYSGAISDVCGSDIPLNISLRGEGSLNKFEQILSIEANIGLLSEVDSEYAELYTNDPNLYRAEYYKDFGSGFSLLYIGKVLPQEYAERYLAPPYYSAITATDSLADLKNYYLLQMDNKLYYGTISLIKLIAFCLSKLKLDLPIRVACNLYADDMDQTDSDDPLDQAFCDFEAIYLAKSEPDLDFVLRHILKPFGASIIQWGGRWNIVRIEEKVASYDYRDFDKNGDYTGNGSYDPVKSLSFPNQSGDVIFVEASQGLEIKPGYGKLRVNYKLGLKPNILTNGDFRLDSTYLGDGLYSLALNTENWILVNGGYNTTSSYERIDNFNVAWKISADANVTTNPLTGESYIKSDTYNVKIGSNNQLNIKIRCKVGKIKGSFWSVESSETPYKKLRVIVRYGDLYLQSNGSWSGLENIIVFHVSDYDEYKNYELTLNQPSFVAYSSVTTYFNGSVISYGGTHWISLQNGNVNNTPTEGAYWTETTVDPVSGMDFNIQIFHVYAFHAQFQSLTALRAFPTYSSTVDLVQTNYKTEVRDSFTAPSIIYYYELEENTSSETGYEIVRPNDYHAVNNPRQWIRKQSVYIVLVSNYDVYPVFFDSVVVKFLTDGKDPFDAIIRTQNAETSNNSVLEEDLIFGSQSDLIVTESSFSIGGSSFTLGSGLSASAPSLAILTTNILSSELIYTGWLRDSDGNGYEFWARDTVAESDKLHGIYLRMLSLQYRRSWRLLRGSFRSKDSFFGFIDVVQEINENNRIYMPIGLSLNDKQAIYSAELLEIVDVTGQTGNTGGGSSGSPDAPFSSGFTTGFGSSGFN